LVFEKQENQTKQDSTNISMLRHRNKSLYFFCNRLFCIHTTT